MIGRFEQIAADLAPFADLGTDGPLFIHNGRNHFARLSRDGDTMEITIDEDGKISEKYREEERKHASIRALLASPSFGDISRWAKSQRILLWPKIENETLPIEGKFSNRGTPGGLKELDSWLADLADGQTHRAAIAIIDGPAGIGKTSIIRSLSYYRALQDRSMNRPLILHVESRGRMLQNITDLMAFSLQTLRLGVTYDQVPPLVRNGLVTLAIDGFDELGDPSGYEFAWAQLNELIASARGRGCLILSGRETFIGKDAIQKALSAFDPTHDILEEFAVLPPSPVIARRWLQKAGWPDRLFELDIAAPLFEEGSYALRPFYLSELAKEGVAEQLATGEVGDLLAFLITAMISREANKFGKDAIAAVGPDKLEQYIRTVMEEVSRDLAENQSDAISPETLGWLAEIAAQDVPSGLVGILKNRIGVMAFLREDDRRGFRRFSHENILNYFLSHVTVRAICLDEVPKYVRRNIFGLEFLEAFSIVVRNYSPEAVDDFVEKAEKRINELSDQDRARGNLAALILAVCSVACPTVKPTLCELSIDELYLAETVNSVVLKNVTIGQLFARETDFQAIEFSGNCHVVSLIANSATVPPAEFPTPSTINLPTKTLSSPQDCEVWLAEIYQRYNPFNFDDFVTSLNGFKMFELVQRVARYKPFWLKDGDEKAARKILEDPNWENLKEIMLKHDLLVERTDVPSSGRPSTFYHFKNRSSLLDDLRSNFLSPFWRDIIESCLDEL